MNTNEYNININLKIVNIMHRLNSLLKKVKLKI